MPNKPTDLPVWGTDLSNETTPSAGQQDTGWTPGQLADSSFDNWYKRIVAEWIDWLNETFDDSKKRIIPAAGFFSNGDVDLDLNQTGLKFSGAALGWAPIVIDVGQRILSIIAFVEENDNSDTITVRLQRQPRAGVALTTVATANISATGEISLAAINHTSLEDNAYTLEVELTTGGGSPNANVTYIEVTYDEGA